jgi:predicted DCC family thiol-disulfide oxidoreductase YuxK
MTTALTPASDRPTRPVAAPLTVLHDPDCPVCVRLASWLRTRTTSVELQLVPVGSPLARARFPRLNIDDTRNQLTVIDASGQVWQGDPAWLMLCSVLPGLDLWSDHLAVRWRRPIVRAIVGTIDYFRDLAIERARDDRMLPPKTLRCTDDGEDSCPLPLPVETGRYRDATDGQRQ